MRGVVETVIQHETKSSAVSVSRPILEHDSSRIQRADGEFTGL